MSLLEQCREKIRALAAEHGLDDAEVTVLAKPLTPEEAIGTPGRRDFPIIVGKERVIEAQVCGARGQAFTDSAGEFVGKLRDVLDLPLTSNRNRALFVATLNATLRHLGMTAGTVHCKDDDPEQCGEDLAAYARKTGARTVGLVGFNPALAEALAREFGPDNTRITDLNRANIGQRKFGVEVWDGRTRVEELMRVSDVIFMTGTTLVNGTFDGLWQAAERAGKKAVIFGITAAGVCSLLNLERWCPMARDG